MSRITRKRTSILVVDDERDNRELLRRALRGGYAVEQAEDGDQAYSVLQRLDRDIALVLCDQRMPGLSGTQLATLVHARWPHIGFIIVTGHANDPMVKVAYDRGIIDGVVAKPWRKELLRFLVAQHLSSRLPIECQDCSRISTHLHCPSGEKRSRRRGCSGESSETDGRTGTWRERRLAASACEGLRCRWT